MNRLIALAALIPVCGLADDPLECVAPEFKDVFLNAAMGSPTTWSTSVPAGFVPLALPADFDLIGSSVTGSLVRVAWQTGLDPDDASASVVRALENEGWREASQKAFFSQRGFQMTIPQATMLCTDADSGSMTVHAWEHSGRTLLSLMHHDSDIDQSCDAMMQRRQAMQHPGMWDALPVLNFPESAQGSSSGSGSNGGDAYTDAVVTTDLTRAGLLSFFGDQVRAQGWTYDTDWSGNLMSGSQWMKGAEGEDTIIGTLSVLQTGREKYHVRFAATSVGSATNGYGGGVAVGFGSTAEPDGR